MGRPHLGYVKPVGETSIRISLPVQQRAVGHHTEGFAGVLAETTYQGVRWLHATATWTTVVNITSGCQRQGGRPRLHMLCCRCRLVGMASRVDHPVLEMASSSPFSCARRSFYLGLTRPTLLRPASTTGERSRNTVKGRCQVTERG
jgi:hypothetical protein